MSGILIYRSMNYFLLVFLGILAIEIGLCTMQKYLYLPFLGKYSKISLIYLKE